MSSLSISSEWNSIFGCILSGISHESIAINSQRFFTSTTSISGMIDASSALTDGTNILLNHFSFAPIVAGRTDFTFLSLPSSASSHINMLSLIISSLSIYHSLRRIPIAIGRSKLGPVFFILAGARLTVIRLVGSLAWLDLSALLRRSLLSWTDVSASHTMVNAGRPLLMSTSTSMIVVSRPFTLIQWTVEIIGNYARK